MQTPKTVAIIGGGIAGCCTAYALAKRGLKVQLFERHSTIAEEASGNPVGLLYPRLSGENAISQYALAAYLFSISFYKSLSLNTEDYQSCGMLQLGFNPRELERVQKVAQNIPAEIAKLITAKEASETSGITLKVEALFFPKAAWLKPKVVCEKLTQQENISVFTLSNINMILNKLDLFEIYSDDNLVSTADIVIIANANDANKFTQTNHLETVRVRGQLTQLCATVNSRKLKTLVCSDGYFTPAINSQHFLGATFNTEDHLNAVTEEDHLINLAKLKTISPLIHETLHKKIISGRVSFRAVSTDHLPLVGEMLDAGKLLAQPPRPSALPSRLPWLKNLYVNIAHGSHGLTSAPLAAEILASSICKETLPISEEIMRSINPNRFILRSLGLKKLAKTVASSNANTFKNST